MTPKVQAKAHVRKDLVYDFRDGFMLSLSGRRRSLLGYRRGASDDGEGDADEGDGGVELELGDGQSISGGSGKSGA